MLWKFSATALAIPVAPTLTAKTIATSGLTPLSIYRYKIAAYNAIGAVTGTEASVTLTGTLNSVSLSWTAVTGALYYRIFRTTANGASNTQTLAGETELTSFVDIKADANLNPITAPAGNTTSGSVNGDAYAANLAPSAIMVDTLSAITAATPLDVIYKNIYGETKYVTVTPAVALGGQVELALSGSGNTIADNRITKPDNVEITNIDVGLQDITSVSNTPVTGAFNIVGNIHLFTCSSSVVNKFETEFFRDPFIFSAGEEIVIGTSANTAVTTGARVDITLITSLE